MNTLFVVGAKTQTTLFIEDYIEKNKFSPVEISFFNSPIKIEDAKLLRKSLAYKVKTKRLFVLIGEITIEAQNSLLKNIEEADSNTYFIFTSENEDSLLTTVRSRCFITRISSPFLEDAKLVQLLKAFGQNYPSWEKIDELVNSLDKKNLDELLPALRVLLLENLDNPGASYYFTCCKKMLPLLSLAKNNNVNQRVVVESIFL